MCQQRKGEFELALSRFPQDLKMISRISKGTKKVEKDWCRARACLIWYKLKGLFRFAFILRFSPFKLNCTEIVQSECIVCAHLNCGVLCCRWISLHSFWIGSSPPWWRKVSAVRHGYWVSVSADWYIMCILIWGWILLWYLSCLPGQSTAVHRKKSLQQAQMDTSTVCTTQTLGSCSTRALKWTATQCPMSWCHGRWVHSGGGKTTAVSR